jgi:hypothetical protein
MKQIDSLIKEHRGMLVTYFDSKTGMIQCIIRCDKTGWKKYGQIGNGHTVEEAITNAIERNWINPPKPILPGMTAKKALPGL